MKKLLTIPILLFTLMFSFTSNAEWTKVGENVHGDFYVDFDRIKKVDGYVYFWELGDLLKPTESGTLSAKIYNQGDCKLFRKKNLSGSFHKEPMGKGTISTSDTPKDKWIYPSPNSSGEAVLKSVCDK